MIPKTTSKSNPKRAIVNTSKKLARFANSNRRLVKEVITGDVPALTNRAQRAALKVVDVAAGKMKKEAKQAFTKVESSPMNVNTNSRTVTTEPAWKDVQGGVQTQYTQSVDNLRPNSADYGETGYEQNVTQYRVWEFKMNPLEDFFTQLKYKAAGYERFNIVYLRVRFINRYPTTTGGTVALSYLTDPSAQIPVDFASFKAIDGATTGNIAAPLTLDITKLMQRSIKSDGYLVQQVPARNNQTGGYYDEDAKPNVALRTPITFLLAIEGLTGDEAIPINPMGSIMIDIGIRLFKTKIIGTGEAALLSGGFSFDTLHPTEAIGFGLLAKRASFGNGWLVGTDYLCWKGFQNVTFDGHVELITAAADVLPTNVVTIYDRQGGIVVPSFSRSFIGKSDDLTQNILTADFKVTLRRGDTIVFGNFPFTGSFSADFTAARTFLSGFGPYVPGP